MNETHEEIITEFFFWVRKKKNFLRKRSELQDISEKKSQNCEFKK